MKKILFLTVIAIIGLFSCKKTNYYGIDCTDNNTKAPQGEIDSIGRYLEWRNQNGANIQATLHPNGFYYQIIKEGTDGQKPETCSTVNVDYKGRRFGGPAIEGTVFDQGEGVSLTLYQTIIGWQQALRMVQPGTEIQIYLPPSLAYGALGNSSIKPNTFIMFDITVNSVF